MAARENQGYLIAVIVLVLLSLVLALTTFLGLSKMGEYADNKASAEQALTGEKILSQAYAIEAEILKTYIGGFGNSVAEVPTQINLLKGLANNAKLEANQRTLIQAILKNVTTAQETYNGDMLRNVSSSEDGQAQEFTWRSLIDNLSTVLAKKHGEYNIKVQQALLAEQDAKTKIDSMQAVVDQMEVQVTTLQDDLKKEKQLAADKQKDLTASLEQGEQSLRLAQTNFDNYRNDTRDDLAKLQGRVTTVEEQNTGLKKKINVYEKEVFDRPDGAIVKVSPSINTVFLDLGRVDGLTENRSFTIYDQSVTNFEKGHHKATIEVTRVLENQAEARITYEDPTNPILRGDYVLTATWDPGHSVPMALAGFFDLDNDNVSDMDKLVQMIRRNGGKVVAWHDDEGVIQGKLDSSVRFLVLGEAPSLGRSANPAVVRAMATMESQAAENTVQVIDLQKLLNRMGVRSKPKIERITKQSGGFAKRRPSDSLKSNDR